jgi:alpha-L-rhamnosidase
VTPHHLRCAHLDAPLAIAPDRVRFGWQAAGGLQRAYQIEVIQNGSGWLSSATPIWDSGKTPSRECTDVPYGGPPLAPGGRYAWRVRTWDEGGAEPEWSEPAPFEVELAAADWTARWIGLGAVREDFTPPAQPGRPDAVASALRPAPYLRRSFTLGAPVAAARLHVTALGLYEARLNGQRVGDACLTPGWTDYDQRLLYQSYDVTGLLREGDNVLGAVLGDGWYCGFVGFDAKRAGAHYGQAPELLAQLEVTLTDGSTVRVVSDEQWQGRHGAVQHADLLMGERHDLRLEPHGWDAPGPVTAEASGAAGRWRPVGCRPLDGPAPSADPGVPVRVTQEVSPVVVTRAGDGTLIVDFGQNLTGWLRV